MEKERYWTWSINYTKNYYRMDILQRIKESTDFISNKFNGKRPLIGIVLGSGLGELAEKIEEKIIISEWENLLNNEKLLK